MCTGTGVRGELMNKSVAAFDMGAGSGRCIAGEFDGERLSLKEVSRFPHNFTVLNNRAYWDVLYLYDSIRNSLSKYEGEFSGMAFDTWGVDFGLVGNKGELMGLPLSYRDSALDEDNMNKVLSLLGGGSAETGDKKLFDETGIASLSYNTVYKLMFIKENMPYLLENAKSLLFLPNLFEYFFSGVEHEEYSISSTSQLYRVKEREWAYDVMNQLGLPDKIFKNTDFSGRVLGSLKKDIAEETGQKNIKVISVSGHDTACAVSAVPSDEEEFTFLSSGTWSLMGISSKSMITGDAPRINKISNEGTWDGGFRPVVNITGLWITQELRRNFESKGKRLSFAEMASMAAERGISKSFIDPDDFMQPGDYPSEIAEYMKETGQPVPEDDADILAIVFTSLALKYREVYEVLRPYITWEEKLYIIGGGIQNRLLCQYTADSLGIPVTAGIPEATAAGNIMQQLKSLGEFSTLSEKAEIFRRSFPMETYLPEDRELWEEAYGKYKKVMNKKGYGEL